MFVLPVLATVAVAASGSLHTAPPEPQLVRPASAVPGSTLPVVKVHRYRMDGKIRPLLFWIGRDDVGAAQIVWRRGDAGAVAYALLIGSDPALAPRGLNRWGYIAEEVRGSDGELLALISKSDEESLGQVRQGLERGAQGHAFSTIRSTVTSGASHAWLWTILTAQDFTFRDVDRVLELVEQGSSEAAVELESIPTGVRPGFLAATAELIRASVHAHRTAPASAEALQGASVAYVYGDSLHDLTLRSHDLVQERRIGDRTYTRFVHGKFETRGRVSRKKTRFEVEYGIEGSLAEVPIAFAYQPRWWLRVKLLLDGAGS